jgi:hypothetical protein
MERALDRCEGGTLKRLISILCLILIPALGILIPAGAQASTVAGGQLYSGKPVKATITTPGQQIKYTFSGTAHKHVTFQVTQFNFSNGTSGGAFTLNFYKPGSTSVYQSCYFFDNGYCDFTTPLTGTWTVRLVPDGASTGSMTLTFARDVATVALTSGTPVNTTIKYQGQHAGYTFAATANKHVTFQVTQFNFSNGTSGGAFTLDFYKPGSTSVYQSCYFFENDYCDFTTPLTGTWTVRLVPDGASTGSMTLTFANDVATVALTSGTPVNTTIKYQGQHAGYTFAATANKHVTFQVTQFNLSNGTSGGAFTLNFYEPGNTSVYQSCYFFENDYCDFTTPFTGTWTVQLVPDGASTGTMTLTFARDVATVALTSGTPVNTTIKYQGQHAGYTFTTTAGATRTFTVTQFNFTNGTSGGAFTLNFYEPGNTSAYQSCYFFENDYCNFTTPLTGTWTVQLVPDGASVGSMTLTRT